MSEPLLPSSPPSAYRLLTLAAAAFGFAALLAGFFFTAAQNATLNDIVRDNRTNTQEHRIANQSDHDGHHAEHRQHRDEHRQLCEMMRQIAGARNITTEPCEVQFE